MFEMPTQYYLIYDVSIPFLTILIGNECQLFLNLFCQRSWWYAFLLRLFLFQIKSFNTDWAFVKTDSSHSDWEREYIKLDIPKVFDTKFLPTIVRRRCDQI